MFNLVQKHWQLKIEELENDEDKSNLNLISKHIIASLEDTTPLALQKILYYIEGFSLAILDKSLFDCSPEAWIHGPVYKNIYEKYSSYKFNTIDKKYLKKYLSIEIIDENTLNLVDEIIKCFGCYSGKTLEKMTHLSTSWLTTREGLKVDEISNREINKNLIKEEFISICQKYHIDNYNDISRYSSKLFKRVF